MESIGAECTNAKLVYDTCFNAWYTNKFLKGRPDGECDELFREYQKCALVVLCNGVLHRKAAIEKKGIAMADLKFDDSLFSPTPKPTEKVCSRVFCRSLSQKT